MGDHPEGAPVRGVKRKVMLPEAVLINSAGSGLTIFLARCKAFRVMIVITIRMIITIIIIVKLIIITTTILVTII